METGRNPDGTFAPGYSGGGRPKKAYSITSMLREVGDQVVDAESGETRAQRLAKQLWALAEGGDKQLAQYVIDRLDGKPKERLEVAEDRVNRVIYEVYDGDKGKGQPEAG